MGLSSSSPSLPPEAARKASAPSGAPNFSDPPTQLPLLHTLSPSDLTLHTPKHLLSTLWRPLQLFNGYRLALALTLALIPFYYSPSQYLLPDNYREIALAIGAVFVSLVGIGFFLSFIWKRHFFIQLSLQVMFDAASIGALTFIYGGVQSSLGLVLLLSIAGASLVTQGKLALFYAAISSFAVLAAESLHLLLHKNAEANFLTAALLCVAFFAIAISVNRLGQRLIKNEELAHQRNIERNNQILINLQVMEHMQDGVLVVDSGGNILSLNIKAHEILQAKNSQQLEKIFPELDKAYRTWKKTKSKAPVILKQSVQVASADAPTPNNAKEISARFISTRTSDETALIFIEDMEHLRNEALQMKLASLGRLTANIAHEIRNPLAAISHATELLQEEAKTSIQTRLVRIINDNSQRLDQIIQEILILGRRGSSEAEREKVMLALYLDRFISDFSLQTGLEEGVLCAIVSEDAFIHFNPAQLQQVLWNIVSNALRYSTRQQGAVRIEARQPDSGVELHIIDDGPGIRHDLRDQIFEPFFTTSTRGTGLGLHIARELCEANRARLVLGLEGGGHFIIAQLNDS